MFSLRCGICLPWTAKFSSAAGGRSIRLCNAILTDWSEWASSSYRDWATCKTKTDAGGSKDLIALNQPFANPIVETLVHFEDERRVVAFVQELAFALSALGDEELDIAMKQDATYSDSLVGVGNVVDFDEWQKKNYAANAARYFEGLLPGGASATPGEQLHFYIRHLHARTLGER